MNDSPHNYEFKQQLSALSLRDQLVIWLLIRRRIKHRTWTISEIYPVVYVLG
jgi:hypothetical protein